MNRSASEWRIALADYREDSANDTKRHAMQEAAREYSAQHRFIRRAAQLAAQLKYGIQDRSERVSV